MPEGSLLRNDQSELRQQLNAMVTGAIQIWDQYTQVAAQCTPEQIRQINHRLVEDLSKVEQQLRQGGFQQQQFGGNR